MVCTAVAFAIMGYIASHPDVALLFMSQGQIDDLANHDFAAYYSEFQPQNFSFNVWTHNAFTTALCLLSGVFIVPVVYILFQNILNVGVVGGVMISAGRSDVFFGLIMPHGLLELTCVFVARRRRAADRLVLDRAGPAPHPRPRTRGDRPRRRDRRARPRLRTGR